MQYFIVVLEKNFPFYKDVCICFISVCTETQRVCYFFFFMTYMYMNFFLNKFQLMNLYIFSEMVTVNSRDKLVDLDKDHDDSLTSQQENGVENHKD